LSLNQYQLPTGKGFNPDNPMRGTARDSHHQYVHIALNSTVSVQGMLEVSPAWCSLPDLQVERTSFIE
jgi:hypothetical protein